MSAALERAELARLDDIARGFAANVAWRSHQASVYAWQLLASYVTLGIVVVVTLGGLGLAVFEILGAVRMAEAAAARGAAADRAQSSLTLSPNQMQITSAVTGVVVLALSLGFLFLFLDRVYPIQPSG
ncbi:MAG: hypothetical protein VYD87_02410 [Pseudomonadota bacterium]|nr:hypothetical protein [Pseudomonadota bacterium]